MIFHHFFLILNIINKAKLILMHLLKPFIMKTKMIFLEEFKIKLMDQLQNFNKL